ncbi:hypothetical protein [Aliiglaciecola litoralis]|uniref:Uncharacterized protein n=1 Tax=Aliiglaciecola litoralis TaxID=582857 RepID=A0ABN1LVE2_9ALTE
MIEIEFEDPVEGTCECCGNKTVRLTRFVYQDDNAFAVYYAQFSHGHDEKYLSGIVGLGEWGDDEVGPEARVAFPFRIWTDDDNFKVGLVDASESPWREVTFLGKILDRAEALEHEWLKDVFHITDHMVVDDKEIVEYFNE